LRNLTTRRIACDEFRVARESYDAQPQSLEVLMGKVVADITISLDGLVAGPNPSLEDPLGQGGERLHEWAFAAEAWRKQHGRAGGERNADSAVIEESIEATGAVVMGRRMYSGGSGPWDSDPNADGWWGDDPPFHVPVFVLTHHPRETVTKEGGTSFTFVTDGVESAVARAREAAGDKDVHVAGGANAIQQALESGLLDEIQLHIAPLLLGHGTRLFEPLGSANVEFERIRVIDSPTVAHLKFRVVS
jgi:dihydrofolate reductase